MGQQTKIEALDRLASLLGQIGADLSPILESADLVTTRAAEVLHQGPPLFGQDRVVHVLRSSVDGVLMRLRHQITGDIPGFVPAESQIRHDGRLLNQKEMISQRALVVFQVKLEGKSLTGIIFRSDLSFVNRAVGQGSLLGVVEEVEEVETVPKLLLYLVVLFQ